MSKVMLYLLLEAGKAHPWDRVWGQLGVLGICMAHRHICVWEGPGSTVILSR